ncbi:hypothetical protein S40285_05791 [Stachybotrys chlorohalonatus IBT 40285]|uniref:FZ domain-containing protein n=1 Tax=Stachybotrys chlorohalonatus (strain IBT 40285) TaxID=1283841 RepID=A0A084QAE8_STAC4|nr:hypothetical protein S40285_05791 [Stachybotrys chlorohalonata IBT 40285]
MHLSPLQSRMAASLAASLTLLGLYLLLISPRPAMALEVSPIDDMLLEDSHQLLVGTETSYEPDFALFDRGIVGRAQFELVDLRNNVPVALNLSPGQSMCFRMRGTGTTEGDNAESARDIGSDKNESGHEVSDEELPHSRERRQDATGRLVYVSANTCLQPNRVSPDATTLDPPQLTLSVSESEEAGCPETLRDFTQDEMTVFNEGAAMMSLNATKDLFIGITAPNISTDFQGIWNYEVAASTDDFYHSYTVNATTELLWMDSDSTSALLVSRNLTSNHDDTQQIMSRDLPYELFVENNSSRTMNGVRHSFCGMEKVAQISANQAGNGRSNNLVRTRMTTRGPGGFPKQEFYFDGLNASSTYSGILYKKTSSSAARRQEGGVVGGGGVVFEPTIFQTPGGSTCRMITDLEFCNETEYSVPGNLDRFNNNTELARQYDNYARRMYSNFEKVMMQIPCETGPTNRYSLARNCDDCANAYKRWLCTVSIPRCEEFASPNRFAVTRNILQAFPNGTTLTDEQSNSLDPRMTTNTSRNSFIDTQIQPGPYREVLPCEEVCYEVVQSCPAAIGFMCPLPGMIGFDLSYGRRQEGASSMACNFPGEARTQISAAGFVPRSNNMLGAGLLVTLLLLLR